MFKRMFNNAKAKVQKLFFKPVPPVKYTVTLPDPVISRPVISKKVTASTRRRPPKLTRWIKNHCGGGI